MNPPTRPPCYGDLRLGLAFVPVQALQLPHATLTSFLPRPIRLVPGAVLLTCHRRAFPLSAQFRDYDSSKPVRQSLSDRWRPPEEASSGRGRGRGRGAPTRGRGGRDGGRSIGFRGGSRGGTAIPVRSAPRPSEVEAEGGEDAENDSGSDYESDGEAGRYIPDFEGEGDVDFIYSDEEFGASDDDEAFFSAPRKPIPIDATWTPAEALKEQEDEDRIDEMMRAHAEEQEQEEREKREQEERQRKSRPPLKVFYGEGGERKESEQTAAAAATPAAAGKQVRSISEVRRGVTKLLTEPITGISAASAAPAKQRKYLREDDEKAAQPGVDAGDAAEVLDIYQEEGDKYFDLKKSQPHKPAADAAAAAAHPERVLENFKLSQAMLEVLRDKGISAFTHLQADLYAPLLKGRCIIARSHTGMGKVLAYAIPAVEKLAKTKLSLAQSGKKMTGRGPFVLVLCPTTELVDESAADIASIATPLSLAVHHAHEEASQDAAAEMLAKGVDILVATPETIVLFLEAGWLRLRDVRFVVVDEAEDIVAMDEVDALKAIYAAMVEKDRVQTAVFSATVTKRLIKVLQEFMGEAPLMYDGTKKV